MSYYMGDYYRGDYYRGDPGFFSFVGRAIKGVVKLATGLGGGGRVQKVLPPAAETAIARVRPVIQKVGPVITKIGKSPVARGVAVGAAAAGAGALLERGMHISKRTGQPVRNRRMHVTNVKALRRAIRRCHGFARLAKKVISFTSPRAARGRVTFKRRSSKRGKVC